MSTKKAAKKSSKANEGVASEPTKEEVGKTGAQAEGGSPANDPKANPMSDPESHAVSPGEMAAMKPDAKDSANAESATAALARQNEREEALREQRDNSTAGRLSRSGLVLNENQNTGERWVGKSIQQDSEASHADKLKTRITPITEVKPFRGLTVKPEGGEPFALGDEFDKDATPAMWLGVVDPATGKSLIAD
jgi:hypothetical protein